MNAYSEEIGFPAENSASKFQDLFESLANVYVFQDRHQL